MPTLRCPDCDSLFDAPSSDFGARRSCPSCGAKFVLDVAHMAHFSLPDVFRVQLVDASHSPVPLPRIVVLVRYGYSLPPLATDVGGALSVTGGMFRKAEADEISTGLMDHRGDYSLNRYVSVVVPTPGALCDIRKTREQSHWPILQFEAELYGNLGNMLDLLTNNRNATVSPAQVQVDLAEAQCIVYVPVCVVDNRKAV